MPIKTYKPTTPGRRGMTNQDFTSITGKKQVKSLLKIKKGKVGRNSRGKITIRHRGGGSKRFIRLVNFSLPIGTTAKVESIEYDPGRSAHIALIKDQDGKYHYVLAAKGMKPGSKLLASEEGSIDRGNRLPLKSIPTGTSIHAIELKPGAGAQLVRSAGVSARLIVKEGNYAHVRLPSGEVRIINMNCMATIGTVGNDQHQNIKWGKAGRKRNKGIRPSVRGKAMNPADHPMGGGEGVTGPGRIPRTPWGQVAIGRKTRSRKLKNKFIARNRHQAKRR